MAYGMGSGLAGSGTVGQLAGQTISAASITTTGASTASAFIPTGSALPANGLYLPFAGTPGIAANNLALLTFGGGIGVDVTNTGVGFRSAAASGTNAYSVTTNGARFSFGAGASDYASSDGTTVTFAGPIANSSASNAIGSAASGTGITVGYNGAIRRGAFKITTTFAAWSAAALFLDITFGVLPAKARLVSVIADTTAAYVLGGGTIVLTVGKTAGGAEYIASHDIKTAAVTKGLADADMGTLLTRAAAIQGGDMAAAMWTGTTNLQGRITSSAGNLSTMSAGSTTFYFIIEYF